MKDEEIEKIEQELKEKQAKKEKTEMKVQGKKVFEIQRIIKNKTKKCRRKNRYN